jgi:hypothetical protein
LIDNQAMTFRYRLLPIGPDDSPEFLLKVATPTDSGFGVGIGDRRVKPWLRVVEHLKAIGARCLLIQEGVRDPDFLEEHAAFYSKQHKSVPRTCWRLHAFGTPCDASTGSGLTEEQKILQFLDREGIERSYLGFSTIRPLRHAPVGPTILAPPAGMTITAKDEFPVHIAGNDFRILGTPFLQQDNAVGACAQASIWMALRTLRKRVGNSAFSPAELTVAATRYLSTDRIFPGRGGLVVEQMLEAVRFAGHDPLHLEVSDTDIPRADAARQMIGPYVDSGLPVILTLFREDKSHEGHAVLAVGHKNVRHREVLRNRTTAGVEYAIAAHWTESFVIHNDNSGPYLELPATEGGEYLLSQTRSAIIPLPEAVFMSAAEAETIAIKTLIVASMIMTGATDAKSIKKSPEIPFVLRVYLCTRHSFRKWAKNASDLGAKTKEIYRTHELSQLVWVAEIHSLDLYDPSNAQNASRCGEIVLDASADALHGDSLFIARLTNVLYPTSKFKTFVMFETEAEANGVQILSLEDLSPNGRALDSPWLC